MIPWWPLFSGTVLRGSRFSASAEMAEKFYRLEDRKLSDGTFFPALDWKEIEGQDIKTEIIFSSSVYSGMIGWSLSEDGTFRLLDRIAIDPELNWWQPVVERPDNVVFQRYMPERKMFAEYINIFPEKAVWIGINSVLKGSDFGLLRKIK